MNETLKALDEQIAYLSKVVIPQLEATMEALQELSNRGEALVPVGPGVFLPLKYEGGKALYSVGADVFMEADVQTVLKKLEEAKENAKQSLQQLRAARAKLISQAKSRGQA